MKKLIAEPSELSEELLQALNLLSNFLQADYENLSKEEMAQFGAGAMAELLGDPPPQDAPLRKEAAFEGRIMRCILDLISQRLSLGYHLTMIRKNPFRKAVPDSDYINVLCTSFDETCYVIHERLKQLSNLLHRHKLTSARMTAAVENVLMTPSKRSRDRHTIFDRVLAHRGIHVHQSNLQRPHVSRLSTLHLFAKNSDGVLGKFSKAEYSSQLKICRKSTTEGFEKTLLFVDAGIKHFFGAANPLLAQAFGVTVRKERS